MKNTLGQQLYLKCKGCDPEGGKNPGNFPLCLDRGGRVPGCISRLYFTLVFFVLRKEQYVLGQKLQGLKVCSFDGEPLPPLST